MEPELIVVLHSEKCACRGASWMVTSPEKVPCRGAEGNGPLGAISIPASEWRALRRPGTAEKYQVALRQKKANPKAT